MATLPYPYPFDPVGTLVSNKIVGEQHIITPANYRDFHYVVPKFAPFFWTGLVVKHRDLNNVVRTLTEGVDYHVTHWFISASRACAKPIYGSISFMNLSLAGVIILDYQTLGGMWTQDEAKIAEILADLIHNPRITAWDVVVDMPVTFPVIDHEWDLQDLAGATEVVQALGDIEATLRATGEAGMSDHIANTANPHSVTKTQVGLGSVQNFPPADGPTTTAGVSAAHYVTPFGLQTALNAGPNAAITAHIGNAANPHGTTAAQVGAYTQGEVNTLLGQKLGINAVAYDTNRFDGLSPTEYRDWALQGTAANALKFNGLTFGEAKDSILTGKAADTGMFEGQDYATFMLTVQGSTVDNALHFGGLLPADYKADVLTGTAANAAQFGSMTPGQWESHLGTLFGFADSTATQVVQSGVTGEAAGDRWLELGKTFFPNGTTIPLSYVQDIHWLIAGGDSGEEAKSSLQILHLSTRGAAGSEISTQLIDVHGTALYGSLGYTEELVDDGTGEMVNGVRVWFKVKENHGSITVTELAQGRSRVIGQSTAVTVEPTGITYIATDLEGLASIGYVDQLRTDMEAALQAMTVAFNDLKTQVEGA